MPTVRVAMGLLLAIDSGEPESAWPIHVHHSWPPPAPQSPYPGPGAKRMRGISNHFGGTVEPPNVLPLGIPRSNAPTLSNSRYMRLADARRAEEEHVRRLADESQRGEVA